MTPGDFEELFRNLSVPAGERALPPVGTIPLDIPAVMAEQRRLGTDIVGPAMGSRRPDEIRTHCHRCRPCDCPARRAPT
jgi:hypothetical protein